MQNYLKVMMGGAEPSPWTPADSPNTYAWYAADKETAYSDNDNANTITDFSGNGFDLDGTGHAPIFKENIVNGHPVFRFDGTKYADAADAADWKLLHDGTDFLALVVFYITLANPDTFYTVLDTGGASTAQIGFILAYDDSSSSARNDACDAFIRKGVVGQSIIRAVSPNDSCPAQTWGVLDANYVFGRVGDDMIVSVDGSSVMTAETTNTPHNSGDPANPLNLGRSAAFGFNLVGDVKEVLIMQNPTPAEIVKARIYASN